MGLESVTNINDLVATNPVATDAVSAGDDHIRALKLALKTDFPNFTTVTTGMTASQAELSILAGVTAGTVTASKGVVVDATSKVDVWNVDNLTIDGNTLTANTGAINITPAAGSAIVLDATINVDAGVVTGATSITSTTFSGDLTGAVTGNADTATSATTAGTVTTAAQTAITSLGTLTALQTDNININGNTIISTDTAGNINVTPDTTGDLILDGVKWPQADGTANQFLQTDGAGQSSWFTGTPAVGVVTETGTQTLTNKTITALKVGVSAGNTANVNSAQGDNPITTTFYEIATCANAGDACTLPTAAAGLVVIVANNGAESADVFPASGDDIDKAGVNTAYALASGSNTIFICEDALDWDTVSGGGLTDSVLATMTGDAIVTTLALGATPGSANNVSLVVGGVPQKPGTDFTVSGSTLTYTTAPGSGVECFAVSGSSATIGTPGAGTVTLAKLAAGTDGELITWDASGNPAVVAVGTAGHILTSGGVGVAPTFQANAAGITKSASDPSETTNPTGGIGTIWLNTTSGEMFSLTDATTNANVWTNIGDGTGIPETYISATGGTITTDGNFKVHVFNSSGTFTPTIGNYGNDTVEYLVIAGGGGGGQHAGGSGGGAGGYLTASATVLSQSYTITIGAGGIGGTTADGSSAGNGTDSLGVGITATGGGLGQRGGTGGNGGSGGGGAAVGTGISGQGFAGGLGAPSQNLGGGGGGASAVGAPAVLSSNAGNGGAGKTSSITGTSTAYAGGGGGGSHTNYTFGTGGLGGGGAGGQYSSSSPALNGVAGTINRGGGGGGAGGQTGIIAAAGAAGGSGIVIIRYQFQAA